MADVSHAGLHAPGDQSMGGFLMLSLTAAAITAPFWRRWLNDTAGVLTDIGALIIFILTLARLIGWMRDRDAPKSADGAGDAATKGGAAAEILSKRGGAFAFIAMLAGAFWLAAALFKPARAEATPVLGVMGGASRAGRKANDDAGGSPTDTPDDTPPGAPAWFVTLWKDRGTHEIAGSRHNPVVVGYFRDAGFPGIKDDETAWCAAAVNAALERNGIPGSKSLAARSFERWGVEATNPTVGDVVVMWRGSRSGWQGHVGLFVRRSSTHVWVLGGNQSDALNVQAFPVSKVLCYRRPRAITQSRTAVAAAGSAATGTLSAAVREVGATVPASPVAAATKASEWGYFEPLREPLSAVGGYYKQIAFGLVLVSVALAIYTVWRRHRDLQERGV